MRPFSGGADGNRGSGALSASAAGAADDNGNVGGGNDAPESQGSDADNFMWESDCPHGVTTWPDSRAIVDLQFEGLPEETKRKVARDNVIRVSNLKV